VVGPPSGRRENGSKPEPPSGLARGRYAAPAAQTTKGGGARAAATRSSPLLQHALLAIARTVRLWSPFMVVAGLARRRVADSAPAQPGREVPAAARISSKVLCRKSGEHNNSLKPTRLAGENAVVPGLPSCPRMEEPSPSRRAA